MVSKVTQEQLNAFRERQMRARVRSARRAAHVRADLPRVVEILVHRYGAKQVILFGSLARGDFHEDSDVDIAAEGLSGSDFFYALADVNRTSPVWVDLKPIEDLSPRFRARAFKTSEVLYGQPIA